MFCYSKDLQNAGIAIDSYKRIMNNHSNKNFIVNNILNMMSIKSVDFLGSYLIFDRNKEIELNEFYGETTDGELYESVKNKLLLKIKKSKKEYIFFCIGCVLYKNDTSHHMIVMIKKSKSKEMHIKIFNSGLYYMEKYQENIENLVKDIIITIGNKPVFINKHMGMSRFGFFLQKSNPQDYCRGGISGILLSYLNYKYSIHNESYCQTWCILMFMYEINAMKREGKDYDMNKNYMKDEIKESKYDLEILIREFMLWIVFRFEKQVGFMDEFLSEISEKRFSKIQKSFSKILEDSFKTLHSNIEINKNINNILFKK